MTITGGQEESNDLHVRIIALLMLKCGKMKRKMEYELLIRSSAATAANIRQHGEFNT